MRFSNKLSDAVHILSYIDIYSDGDLSSQAIADSIGSNPSVVRRLMSRLTKAGLLQTRPGIVAPALAKIQMKSRCWTSIVPQMTIRICCTSTKRQTPPALWVAISKTP